VKWSSIKDFFHNPVIKVSYVVVIGLPLFFEMANGMGKAPTVPLGIFLLFFAALALLIGAGVYFSFCPREIKNYKDIHDYKEKHKPDLLAKDPGDWLAVVLANMDYTELDRKRQIEQLLLDIRQAANPEIKKGFQEKLMSIVKELYPSKVVFFLENKYADCNENINIWAKIACFILLGIGTLLTLWVFGERIVTVIRNIH